ncbi:MAG: hypothetical protein IJK89_03825 [Clostridia bacterium]|nr:hypothetical protein [Clostridia bacterium]
MSNTPNENNGVNDVYRDISAIFNIDERKAAGSPVEKTTDAPKKNERILTAPEGMKHLPRDERKKMKKDERREKRAVRLKKAKTRAIIVLSAALAVAVIAGVIRWKIVDAKKPVVAVTRAVVETLDRSYTDSAVISADGKTTVAVLIDNDYDVHFIAKNLRAEVVNAAGATVTGKVTDIKEEKPGADSFTWLASALLGELPEVPFYAVYITLDDPDGVLLGGEKATARIITETAENAVVIPAAAVFMDGAQPYVWIYHPFTKTLSRQDIAVGVSSDEQTEVLRGLDKGDRVISGSSVPSSELYEGVKVKLK